MYIINIPEMLEEWGNKDWAAPMAFIEEMVDMVALTDGPIVECGSGVTTLLLDKLCDDRPVHTLEHDRKWHKKIVNEVDHVRVHLTPIVDYGEYQWYKVPKALPDNIGLMVCDGPPGHIGRYGAVPQLRDKMAPDCIILMDDGWRESEVMEQWRKQFGITYRIDNQGRGIGHAMFGTLV